MYILKELTFMDEATAELLSRKIHIAKEPIVREEYEMIFLQGLLASSLNNKLIFKGGTALRMAYSSPRFSEDLDFALKSSIKQEEFDRVVRRVVESLPTVKIKELTEKYYTHFALLSIRQPYLRQAFSIKIEVSKRPVFWKEGRDFLSQKCKSEVSSLEAVGLVVTLKRAFLDKKKAVKTRQKARDWFDLWWLGEKLGKPTDFKFSKSELVRVRAELNQFLPEHMRKVVDLWRKDE